MKKLKETKGITLIALVITIIVLLILAAVSIATLTGENGVLTKASTAKEQTEIASAKEQAKLDIAAWIADKLDKNESTELTNDTIKSILTGKDYVGTAGDSSFTTAKGGYEIPYSELTTTSTGGKTLPFLPTGATVVNDDLATGVIIKDSNNNEWVWIEVPKSIYTTATSNTDYANIEKDMQTYASDYREDGYTDTWYSEEQHGFASADDYNNYKNAMLKSVYDNGGFYIGKYEVGTRTARATKDDALTTPIIQQDAYPYNFVTCKQAQSLSNQLATGGKTSSLMFGIQWDLVLKHIENKGRKTQDELKSDSSTWGNYSNISFDITRGQYSTDNGSTFTEVSSSYTKPDSSVLLTTGATDRNSTLNIYDLAGNIWEWTLEYTAVTDNPCSFLGGCYRFYGSIWPASFRSEGETAFSGDDIGFRPALY